MPDRGLLGVADSTIFNNTAAIGAGAAASTRAAARATSSSLDRATIADNVGGVRGAGGVYASLRRVVRAQPSICRAQPDRHRHVNCDGTIAATINGANVENDKECDFELQGANPRLATTLTNQGGEVDVLPLSAAQPRASTDRPLANCPAGDERRARHARARRARGCDSGAYELDQARRR